MDDLSMINVDVNWMEEQMFVRCMRTDCAWEDEIEPTASSSIPALIERAQRHVLTHGEPITERAVFTQRDVDPLGRGNAAQRVGAAGDDDGLPRPWSVIVADDDAWKPDACVHYTSRSDDTQRSDLHKRDENTLRSDQA